jgi:hypothetical protein
MSDFTKEELHELLISLSCRFSRQLGLENKEHLEFSLGLEVKIQSMIDNYCEHDGEIGKDYPGEKCMKCSRMWE